MPPSRGRYEPWHGVGGMGLDQVGMRIRVDAGSRSALPFVLSNTRAVVLRSSLRRALGPVGVPALAELDRSPNGEIEVNRRGAPSKVRYVDGVRPWLAGQVQFVVLVCQLRRNAELASLDPLDLTAVPTDEA